MNSVSTELATEPSKEPSNESQKDSRKVSNVKKNPLPILLIGGTDPSGAGLQVDWKVANALAVEASSIVTAVTAQNSKRVLYADALPTEIFKAQLKAIENNRFSVIKVGMLANEKIIEALIEFLENRDQSARENPLIIDPVLMASSGGKLLTEKGIALLLSKLLPLASLITPNLDELAVLTKLPVSNQTEIKHAAKALLARGVKAVFVKGGHDTDKENSTDLLITNTDAFYLRGKRWADRQNVRGTGCALASSMAAMISKGFCLNDAVVLAKTILSQGIREAIKVEGEAGEAEAGAGAKETQRKLIFSTNTELNFELQDLPKLSYSADTKSPPNFLSCGSNNLGIYPVVDSVEWIKKLVPLGVETIQLRIKIDKPDLVLNQASQESALSEIEQKIKDAIIFCKVHKVRLFINDHWKIALKHDAYGIHLGQEDLAKLSYDDLQRIANAKCRLGLSTHSFYEVARAHKLNPSYIALGPIFTTTSKIMPWIPQGVSAVKMWVNLLGDSYPLVAIGGINTERASALKATGIGSVAMITAITKAIDYKVETQKLLALWDLK